jgi:transposase-like protein
VEIEGFLRLMRQFEADIDRRFPICQYGKRHWGKRKKCRRARKQKVVGAMNEQMRRLAPVVAREEMVGPDPEVVERPKRRHFSAAEKLRILQAADACVESGEVGALLRREGLYASHLSVWRRQRESGALAALAPKRRGRPPQATGAAELRRLQAENARLQRRLEVAETVIEVQKKVSALLGLSLETPSERRS